MIVPITRKEKLLNAIATNGNVDFVPKTREELFLFKILGADVNTPTPITRKELLYQHIIDGTIPTFEPRTRLEKFIMAAAGVGLELPVVLTREEYWWAEISDSAYKTITGAIVHFISKRARAIKSLIANISYTQDLNGYSYPWPAGGGKNKFNGTFLQGYWAYADGKWVNSPNWITTEKIPCKASTSYTVSADAKVTRWQGFVWYDSNGDFISTDNLNSNVNIGLTKTSPSNAAYLIFNIAGYPGANDTIAPSDVTYFQLEEGSSSTAYAPYSNICPISGWTGANVYHSGADTSDATTYSITFPSEAGTVYGGTLDVTNGKLTVTMAMRSLNGTENWASVTANGHTRQRVNSVLIGIKQITGGGQTPNLISDRYPTKTPNATYAGTVGITNQQNSEDLYIMDNRYDYVDSASDYKTWLSTNNLKVVYELAEPVTYQLTPTEVTTLLGDNTIWADTGDVSVTY